MRTLKEAALDLLSTEQSAMTAPYFDFLIQGMQTTT
jgi:allophycocyanin-B